ncbi:MAG: glycosyltransferase family 2 protein [Hyphomonas sp.]
MEQATVIIPCYNAEETVAKAVRSALGQTIPVRVIVVDDCSSDGSFALLETLAASEPRLTVIRQERNAGPSAARNAALRCVETPWVTGLDADDYLLPDRLQRMVHHAETRDLDFVADDVVRVQPGQSPEDGLRVWRDEEIGAVPMDLARFVRENLAKYAGQRREIGYLKPLMRTEFLRKNELSFREDMRLAEDYEFYVRSLTLGARWEIIDPCGYIAVSMPESLSKTFPTHAVEKLVRADEAFLALPGLARDARRALKEHLHFTRTDFAWRTLIDGGRTKDPALVLRALVQPPAVSAKVLLRTVKHLLGIRILPETSDTGRPRAGETARLRLS